MKNELSVTQTDKTQQWVDQELIKFDIVQTVSTVIMQDAADSSLLADEFYRRHYPSVTEMVSLGVNGYLASIIQTTFYSVYLEKLSEAEKSGRTCKTYIVKDMRTGLYKIGRTTLPSVWDRLNSWKHIACASLDLILVVPCDVEAKLHRHFDDVRVRGEWFQLSSQDLQDLPKIVRGLI